MIQARVATRILPANTSSKIRPRFGLFQRVNDDSPFRQISLCGGPLPCWLIAALDVGNPPACVSPWDRSVFVSLWDRFWAMERRFPHWGLDLQIDLQGRSQLPLAPSAAELPKCESAMATRNEAVVLSPVIAYRVFLLLLCVHSNLAARRCH
jgi:hypothetical protein